MSTEQMGNSMEDFLSELDNSMKKIHQGDILKGTVLSVKEDEVLVNIGYIADGVILKEELSSDTKVSPIDLIKPGDEVFVYVLEINDGEGNVALSKKRADAIKIWDDLAKIVEKDETITVTVKEVVKGGVTADFNGVRAFIPASQLSLQHVEDLSIFVGKELEVKIIEADKEKKNIVLSRKVLELKQAEEKKDILWNSLKKGEKRIGIVKRLVKFGAFVDIGGVDGLIHINDLSWKRVVNPADVVSIGDEVDVYVLDFDKSKNRIALGLKDISQKPWNVVKDKFKIGMIIDGTVTKVMDYGAFVEIESGVEGLVHISEISEERITKTSDVLKSGDTIKVKILDIDFNKEKVSLSIKEAVDRPKEDFSKYNDNDNAGVTLADLFKDKLKDLHFD